MASETSSSATVASKRLERRSTTIAAADPEPGWAQELVETVAEGMSGSVFKATVNPGCRVCPVAGCCPVHERGAQVDL